MGSSSVRGKLYAKANDNQKINFGIARNASAVYSDKEFDLNSTVLVVMKYHFVADTESDNKNDIVSLYINPTITEGEPSTPDAVSTDNTTGPDLSAIGSISIFQAGTKAADTSCPTGTIDAIRVSTTWEGLFTGTGEEPTPTPTINIESMSGYVFIPDDLFVGMSYPYTLTVNAENLQGDITVTIGSASGGEVTSEQTTIAKADAEAGYNFPFTISPKTAMGSQGGYETITFASEGAETVEITLMWSSYAITQAATIAEFKEAVRGMEEYELYDAQFSLNGEVTVTHAYTDGGDLNLFVEDATGGLKIVDQYSRLTQPYTVGDKLSHLTLSASVSFGSTTAYAEADFGAPISTGNEVTPATLTLADLKANGSRYEGCLVKVEDVTFTMRTNETGIVTEGKFGDDGLFVHIKQGNDSASIDDLSGADFVGENVPASARSVTGISTSSAGTAIAPRSLADIDADFESGEDPDPGTDPDEPGNEVEVGDNLFLDPSFENGRSSILGVSFDDWSVTSGALENTLVTDGETALKITGSGNAKIEQEIGALNHTFTAGEAYALTMHYYVVKTQGDNDIQLNCAWGGVDVEAYDTAPLTQGFTGTVGAWESKRVRVVVPAGRQISFQFGLKVPSGAEVIFDDFSFRKLESITTGIATPADNGLVTWSEGGVLYLGSDRAQTVNVYSLNGVLVNRANLSAGVNTLALPAGAYLLQGGNGVQKVLVK